MDLKELQKPLEVSEIDFRIQSINNGKYATILAYKDARVDMQRLDDVCGVLGWKREHSRDNKNCTVSLWDEFNEHWVSKEDTGTESQAEAQKGLASDSFKRSCFNLGIGRELYDYPVISIRLNDNEVMETGKPRPKYKGSYDLNLKDWTWFSSFNDGKLVSLSCTDTNGKIRFSYPKDVVVTPNETVAPTNPNKLDDKRFKAALEALSKGATTKEEILKYSLTPSQKEQLNKA